MAPVHAHFENDDSIRVLQQVQHVDVGDADDEGLMVHVENVLVRPPVDLIRVVPDSEGQTGRFRVKVLSFDGEQVTLVDVALRGRHRCELSVREESEPPLVLIAVGPIHLRQADKSILIVTSNSDPARRVAPHRRHINSPLVDFIRG